MCPHARFCVCVWGGEGGEKERKIDRERKTRNFEKTPAAVG